MPRLPTPVWINSSFAHSRVIEVVRCVFAAIAPSSPKAQAQAATSVVETGTSDKGQDVDVSGDKSRKGRKKKDPAAPKKALTGYLVYINSKREQVIKEHPEADLVEQVSSAQRYANRSTRDPAALKKALKRYLVYKP